MERKQIEVIISKGEIVEGNKYDILKSLEAEYESQVWTDSNYYWVLGAYTLLVALALLMLLLFIKKTGTFNAQKTNKTVQLT